MTDDTRDVWTRREPRRDRYGRYLLPHPTSGVEQPWTRVTTLSQTLSDKFGLNKWEQRMVCKGLSQRQDLLALAASAPADDKSTLDKVAADAKEAALAKSGANSGTALHRFVERVTRGDTHVDIPDPWAADIAAYQETIRVAEITADPELLERIVVVSELDVAGTLDAIVHLPDGRPIVLDLKTGKDLSYAWGEIAIQLACYAHGDAMWNQQTGTYEPMPAVDQTHALVAHLPVGQSRCTIHTVDIEAGWQAAQQAADVRDWRRRKNLSAVYIASDHATAGDRDSKVRDRVDRLKAHLKGGPLPTRWPAGVTPPSRHPDKYATGDLDQVEDWLDTCESELAITPY